MQIAGTDKLGNAIDLLDDAATTYMHENSAVTQFGASKVVDRLFTNSTFFGFWNLAFLNNFSRQSVVLQ